jgi:subtilisin family serine protease
MAKRDAHAVLKREMMRSVITEPLLSEVERALKAGRKKPKAFDVIISLNVNYACGSARAVEDVQRLLAGKRTGTAAGFVFASLTARELVDLVERDRAASTVEERQRGAGHPSAGPGPGAWHAIYRIWLDHEVEAFVYRSAATIKANAAQTAFQASGQGIVWAVLDTGIDGDHPHFRRYNNLDVTFPLGHKDFTVEDPSAGTALQDPSGHGTHVAGILAGALDEETQGGPILQAFEQYDPQSETAQWETARVARVAGIAPQCQLVSLKVLNDQRGGKVSSILRALDWIQEVNSHGRRLLIHGVNLSLGHGFDPRWFACGQSPLCTEVNRLVRSGVCVVVAAGNSGYDTRLNRLGRPVAENVGMSVNDPGNAELAVTVGATHRDMPHTYGVSYFSSKGPTGDGRLKPDLVAPGERIVSCASKEKAAAVAPGNPAVLYYEETGTSMAAPHVSGAMAAFLSVRREFIGQPERVKEIFVKSAVDLQRIRYFQGAGLVDLLKALQSV